MKKNLKTAQLLSKFFFLYILCFALGCSYKAPPLSKISPKNVYYGKIWWEITLFTNNETKTLSNYADFQVEEDFLYLRFKSPLNTTLGYGKWETSFYNLIEIFDLYNQKHYFIILEPKPELKDIPLYFLGLKEKILTWNFLKTSFYYSFSEDKKEGTISSDLFILKWRFKDILISEDFTPMLKDTSLFKDFQKVEITL
uniref:Lipoprotein n=1 Tax=Thermodesulfobacterium geofontis TaxID=1295609 RepID=A0A7V4JP30_9BACT